MFAVEPKPDCPHIESDVNLKTDDATGQAYLNNNKCHNCADPKENWVCLHPTCNYKVFCSRYVNSHMAKHNEQTDHCIALSFADLSVWCYKCDSYITHPTLKEKIASAYRAKFGADIPTKKKKKRKQYKMINEDEPKASGAAAASEPSTQLSPADSCLFVYGSLQHEAVRKMVFKGSDVAQVIQGASLDGYTVASLEGKSYPGLVETPNSPSKAQGCLLGGLGQEQFDILDHFEGKEYRRITVQVNVKIGDEQRTTKAFTYLWANPKDALVKVDTPWDYAKFVSEGLASFLTQEAANAK